MRTWRSWIGSWGGWKVSGLKSPLGIPLNPLILAGQSLFLAQPNLEPKTNRLSPRMLPQRLPASVDTQSVFLNIPFDHEYSPLFLALMAGLAGLGRTPRCVLEVPSGGRSRLERIFSLIASCEASIHDLSRVGLSGKLKVPRFNMPFELGITYALSQITSHGFFVLEERAFRLQASLSDLNGHDPHIHDGTPTGVLRCVLDCFGTPAKAPPLSALETLTERLTQTALELQREHRTESPFHPYLFRQIEWAAAKLARRQRLI